MVISSNIRQRPTTVATKQTLPLGDSGKLDRAGGPGVPLDRTDGPGAPLDRTDGPGVPLDRTDGPGAPLDRVVPKIPTPSHAPDHTPNDACKSEDIGAVKTSLRVARQRRTHKAQGPMPQAPVRNEPMEEDDDEDGHRKVRNVVEYCSCDKILHISLRRNHSGRETLTIAHGFLLMVRYHGYD